jgi:hypothetical protein
LYSGTIANAATGTIPSVTRKRVSDVTTAAALEFQHLLLTVRFVQGYRYLDRCGETLVKLEKVLDNGWLPHEPLPTSGTLRNDVLGMTAAFNSSSMTVQQGEFISTEKFTDQVCKLFETIWRTLEIEAVLSPAAMVRLQRGFAEDKVDDAERYMRDLRIIEPNPEIVSALGGNLNALESVVVTGESVVWSGVQADRRRRLQASVVRQEKQNPFDNRLLSRVKLLPARQQEAMAGLRWLRSHLPETFPVAAQFDLEHSMEGEFATKSFDLPGFLDDTWSWANDVRAVISKTKRG